MRDYGQIQSAYWTHPDIQAVSIEAKLIGAYLLTCQHTNGIGCFRMPIGYVSIDLGMGIETVSKGFRELFQRGFLEHDEEAGYVLIPNFLRWNPTQNPNSAKARAKEFDLIPSSISVYPNLIKALLEHGGYWEKAFRNRIETLSKGFRKGSERVPEDVPDNQNQNQNQNQKTNNIVEFESASPELDLSSPELPASKKTNSNETREIFEHWQSVLGHEKAKLDDTRKRRIKNALGWGYSPDDLKQAITGCSKTPHNLGQNDRGQRYDGLDVILRTADQIDRFMRNAHHPPTAGPKPASETKRPRKHLADESPT